MNITNFDNIEFYEARGSHLDILLISDGLRIGQFDIYKDGYYIREWIFYNYITLLIGALLIE